MKFTYESYAGMVKSLISKGYYIANYENWKHNERTIILRHDVDFSLQAAVELAEFERTILKEEQNKAIYFVLVSTDFYNIFSKESKKLLLKIIECGGEIGLHFDETQYNIETLQEFKECVIKEKNILQDVIGAKINVVSMHRPSQKFLMSEMIIDGLINAYGKEYFHDMKYISDSRRNWREDIDDIILKEQYNRLCILTHPVWYDKEEKINIKQAIYVQLINSVKEKYINFSNNITDFETIFSEDELNALMERLGK